MARKNRNQQENSPADNTETKSTTTQKEEVLTDEKTQDNETKASEDTPVVEESATPLQFYTDIHGGKWHFKKNTPKSFRFNEVVKTKEEWLSDEDAMEMLVYGNSTYVKQIKE